MRRNRALWLLPAIVAALAVPASAQPVPETAMQLRAALVDGAEGQQAVDRLLDSAPGERSVPLAFVMSAVVPGGGQAYNRQWLKAAGFVAAEVAVALAYQVSYSDAVAGRDDYQAYAHRHWDPARYGYWLNDYKRYLNEVHAGPGVSAADVQVPLGIDFTQPDAWTAAERRAVDAFFNDMRRLEDHLYHTTGASFAHRIPFFGEQQYYELIGKYFHFAPGWEDYAAAERDGRPTWIVDGEFLASVNPDETDAAGRYIHASDRYWDYRDRHAHANALFRRASRITSLFIANHLIAAVDAAVFAKLHNDRLETTVSVDRDLTGALAPTARLTYRF